jgi:beta-lactamase class A
VQSNPWFEIDDRAWRRPPGCRAGLPEDWTVADKTGTGSYGTTNDVGIAWPPGRGPIVLAVLSTQRDAAASADEPLVARTAALVAAALT